MVTAWRPSVAQDVPHYEVRNGSVAVTEIVALRPALDTFISPRADGESRFPDRAFSRDRPSPLGRLRSIRAPDGRDAPGHIRR